MVWNLPVSYNKHELITWIMREAVSSVCTPLERLLVCIWGEKMGRNQWAKRAGSCIGRLLHESEPLTVPLHAARMLVVVAR